MNNYSINVTTAHTGALISSTQGALFHDNKIYQFRDNGTCLVCDKQFNKLYTFQLPTYIDNTSVAPHCSAVEWVVPGEKVAVTTNATGQVNYADRIYVYDISDLSNITQEAVILQCTDKTKYARMAAMGYDQVNKVMYVAGYTSGSSSNATSTCWFESFDFSDYINNGTLIAPLLTQAESDGAGLHIQDGGFYNGYFYLACDHSNTVNGSYDGLYLWVLDTDFNNIAVIDADNTNTTEGEAFYIVPETHGTKFVLSSCKSGQTYYQLHIFKTGTEEDPIKYTAIFKDWNNKIISDQTLAISGVVTIPENPTRDGYTFLGWTPSVSNTAEQSIVYTAQYQVIAEPTDDPTITLEKTLNVVGYLIDGVEHREDLIQITSGTHTVSPILRAIEEQGETLQAVFNGWDDDDQLSAERTVTVGTENVTLKAYGVQETIFLYGMPAPIAAGQRGTSFTISGTAAAVYLMVSSNTTYKNEYIATTTQRYNDEDLDVATLNSNKFAAETTTYLEEHNITEGMRFFGAVPAGYTKATVKIINGEGEDNTPTSRNPNVIFATGDSYSAMFKVYGNTDVTRPLSSTIVGDGLTFDYSSMEVANQTGAQDFTGNMKAYNLIVTRLIGNTNRLNNSIVRIHFSK